MIECGDTRPWIGGLAGYGPGEEEKSKDAWHPLFVPQGLDGIKRTAKSKQIGVHPEECQQLHTLGCRDDTKVRHAIAPLPFVLQTAIS